MGKVSSFTVASALIILTLVLLGCGHTNFTVVVEEPTSVYEDYPPGGPPTAKVITTLNKGDTAEVLRSRWAKDCEYLQIRLKDGRKGYVGWDGKYKLVHSTDVPGSK
jgi:hypothetical protein